MRPIAVLLAALVAAACGGDELEATHRGAYFGGDNRFNMNMFTPCGDTATLFVEGNPQTVERLRRKHEAMSPSMFRPIYIEVRGKTAPISTAQYLGELYTGILHIDTVLVTEARAPMNCAPKLRPLPPDIG